MPDHVRKAAVDTSKLPRRHVSVGPARAPHSLDRLARLCRRGVAVPAIPSMRGAVDVEIGDGAWLLDHLIGAGEEGGRNV